jgi:hypothetical protein
MRLIRTRSAYTSRRGMPLEEMRRPNIGYVSTRSAGDIVRVMRYARRTRRSSPTFTRRSEAILESIQTEFNWIGEKGTQDV